MRIRRFFNLHSDTGSPQPSGLERCDDVAYLLTALFDNEATEDEARRARLHLLACQRCADTFRNWNQARIILREEPVPAPPPSLLWRVLMACRLASMSGTETAEPSRPSRESLSAVPASLQASILAATVGKTKVPTKRRSRPLWHPYSWPSLASPALAMWLVLLNMTPGTQPLISQQPVSAVSATSQIAPVAESRSVGPRAVRTEAHAELKAISKPAEVPAADSRPTEPAARADQAEVRHLIRPVREEAPESSRPAVAAEVSEPAPAPEPVVRPVTTEVAVAPVLKPASMADDGLDHPRSERASFRPLARAAIVRLAKSPGGLRVSTPDEPVSTPLVLASAGDTDNRLDEVQSTVQDFRALFASDGSGGSDDDSATDGATAAG